MKAKYIDNSDDLSYMNDHKFDEIVNKASHGALEIQVIDNGIGIKKENQEKLFQLFGFLEDTKELNTKGIGLGLHICQQIVQQFGGHIKCDSRWGHGTTFVFLFILDEQTMNTNQKSKRVRNPIQKSYPKL